MHVDNSGHIVEIAIPLAVVSLVIICAALTILAQQSTESNASLHIIPSPSINGYENKDNENIIDRFHMLMLSISLIVADVYFRVKSHIEETDRHHIIAKSDCRAAPARCVLTERCKIGINDDRNIAKIKRKYHQVIHTNAYHFIVNTDVISSYLSSGKEGVIKVLEKYKEVLENL